jgi:hypothetical protein
MGVSRYNIVNNADLRMVTKKQESYLQIQMGTISGTIHILKKKGNRLKLANPLILLVPGAGIEPARGLNLEGF